MTTNIFIYNLISNLLSNLYTESRVIIAILNQQFSEVNVKTYTSIKSMKWLIESRMKRFH